MKSLGYLLLAGSLAFSLPSHAQTVPEALNIHSGGRSELSVRGMDSGIPVKMIAYPNARGNLIIPTLLYTHQWPGTYFEAAFTGSQVDVKFDDAVNILRLQLDDQEPVIFTKPGKITHEIRGLSQGPHRIRVEKITESQGAVAGFNGFVVPSKQYALPAPTPRARQIEFIGDSYTVGYGNTSPKRECTVDEVWATTDTSQAFGPIAAKAFNADYQINAYSGRGIVRNYDGFVGDTLPQLYKFTLFDGKTEYVNTGWKPQIIVIGLGTNDFSTPLKPGQKWKTREKLHADYEATYVAFVKSLRAKNPNAYFILMAADNVEGETLAEVTKVEAKLKAGGETKLTLIPMRGLNFGGCHAHPDVGDDKVIARLLSDFINAHPDLWQGR